MSLSHRRHSTMGRPRERVSLFGVALLLTLLLLVVAPGFGQSYRAARAATSAAWWTLSDAVSPDDLRTRHTDPLIQRQSFEASPESSLTLEGMTPTPASEVVYYFSPAEEPEMTPFWLALQGLAIKLEYSPQESTEEISRAGLSERAQRIIEAEVRKYDRAITARSRQNAAGSSTFVGLMRVAFETERDRTERGRMYERWLEGELSVFAQFLPERGLSPVDLAGAYAAWREDPAVDLAEELLPQLRSSLSEEDWNGFREFLLLRVVPGIGSITEVLPYD